MSILVGNPFLLNPSAAGGYQVSRSLRFNSSDSAYLSRAFSSTGNQKTATFAFWLKRTTLSTVQYFYDSSSTNTTVLFGLDGSDNKLSGNLRGTGGTNYFWSTNAVFRDPSAWYHVVIAFDTTQSTAANRLKVYVNGIEQTFSSVSYCPQDTLLFTNDTRYIGQESSVYGLFNGYLADIHFIDGQALTPSSFAETDATTGAWNPKAYTGTYPGNSFHLDFADNSNNTASTLGKDTSGLGNNWDPYNLSVTAGAGNDSTVDSPSNYGTDTGVGGEVRGNYCTLNPLDSALTGLNNGNLQSGTSGASSWKHCRSTLAMSSGKWYWEYVVPGAPDASNGYQMGVLTGAASNTADPNSASTGFYTRQHQTKYANGTVTTTFSTLVANDIVMFAFDADSGKLWTGQNGTWYNSGSPSAGTNESWSSVPTGVFAMAGSYGSTFSVIVNFGQRPFAHPAPSGYKALCTANLPTPTIAKGSDYFDVKLYTGNGSTQTISGLNFSPDWVWIKNRSHGRDNNVYDTVRGATKLLSTNGTTFDVYDGTGSEQTVSGLTAFNSDGFTVGSDNVANQNSPYTYAAWCWDAGANSSKTYTVTVVSDKFHIDGKQQPTLNLEEGSTYTFDLSAASNSGHPFRLSESANGPTQYTTGVTTSGTAGNAGATLTIAVASGAPPLYYFCTNHSGMGGQINTNTTAGASNFAGSITSVVRANASAGFSIATWTLGSSNVTVGHGLGVTPGLIICKSRTGVSQWIVYHTSTGIGGYLYLSATSAVGTNIANVWSPVNSTVFGVDTGLFPANADYVSYHFAPVAGYSSFGSYTGNGSPTDGPFVYTGFRPKWILIKRTDVADDWPLMDTVRTPNNPQDAQLYPNFSNAESNPVASSRQWDALSNGFKIRGNNDAINKASGTYIYAAFAESPFAYARAR